MSTDNSDNTTEWLAPKYGGHVVISYMALDKETWRKTVMTERNYNY